MTAPTCGTGQSMQLMAQAVPSATRLPCVAHLPVGWSVGTAETIRGKATFAVGVGDGSSDPVTVTLTEILPGAGRGHRADPVRRRMRDLSLRPSPTRTCRRSRRTAASPSRLATDLIAAVAADDDQVLCGALAPPCP